MSDIKLGQLIDGEAHRDAIHIAVYPATAGDYLEPGDHVGLDKGDGRAVMAGFTKIGIVDPYLKYTVKPGERFYLFLYPNTVTSLRHEWTHPAFEPAPVVAPDAERVERAKKNIIAIAALCGVEYDDLMNGAAEYLRCGEYLHMGDNEAYKQWFWGNAAEFWTDYEAVTGATVDDKDASFFSCSC